METRCSSINVPHKIFVNQNTLNQICLLALLSMFDLEPWALFLSSGFWTSSEGICFPLFSSDSAPKLPPLSGSSLPWGFAVALSAAFAASFAAASLASSSLMSSNNSSFD
jgi:hypothetical protein